MSAKPPARLKKVAVDLKLFKVEWESDERELVALRGLMDAIRTRRAFEISRASASEEPVYFLTSITEFRTEVRDLMKTLPPASKDARLVMLAAMDWTGEVLDAWHQQLRIIAPNLWEFQKLPLRQMMQVMERAWPVVEDVRKGLNKLGAELEKSL